MKLSDFWIREFLGPNTNGTPPCHCGLCGNSGIIDTRGKVFTAAGVACGGVFFCICPNGRAIKRQAGKRTAKDFVK